MADAAELATAAKLILSHEDSRQGGTLLMSAHTRAELESLVVQGGLDLIPPVQEDPQASIDATIVSSYVNDLKSFDDDELEREINITGDKLSEDESWLEAMVAEARIRNRNQQP